MLKWHFSVAQQPKPQKSVQVYFVQQLLFWEDTTLNCKEDIGDL